MRQCARRLREKVATRWKTAIGQMALAVIVSVAALAPGGVLAQTGSCGAQAVRMADQNWESAGFTTHVISEILQRAFGCEVEVVPGTTAALESALAQNDIQIIAEQWSGRSPIIEEAIERDQIRIIGDTLAGGAQQGWYVPDYVVHGDAERGIAPMAPDLRTWRDLPRYKALFTDPEQPDKGRFLNCPTGWVCELTNSRLLRVHGLEDDFTNFRAGTGAALDSAISSAYEQGRPVLFYYWQPAGLMAKYQFHRIEQDPFDEECWQTLVSGAEPMCSSDFLLARLSVAVSTPFAQNHPELLRFFERLQFEPQALNGAILVMTEDRVSGQDMALDFLRANPDVWAEWLPEDAAHRLRTSLGLAGVPGSAQASAVSTDRIFPQWSMAQDINKRLLAVVERYGVGLRAAGDVLLTKVLLPVERVLMAVHPWLLLAVVALLGLHATRRPLAAIAYVAGLYLIGAAGLWDKLIQTFSLVMVATLVSIVIGVPAGIVGARVRMVRRIITPVMDVMQTLPSFVYLVPVLMLFGLGKVPALFATVVYAVPPLIRLTILGLRQVDHTITEAAQSFGVTPWQMLMRVTLPLARPSIMAGINQATMMALAMVVVASMIGARGLGEDVLAGIQTLDVGRGLEAGVAIVILAIVMDRITQAYGQPARIRRAGRRRVQPALVPQAVPSAGQDGAVADAQHPDESRAELELRDVYKVFGPRERQAMALLGEGMDKADVQARTGSNVGLAGISLQIPAGRITCIMGLSGSGKSTLVRHLNRLIDPSAGSILLEGRNILELGMAELRRLRRYNISMVFQNFGLLPHLTVLQNVAFGLRVRGESRAYSRRTAQQWLERVDLLDYADNYPDELSGGMRQRVGLARALAIDARILLMDEPFSALDPLIRYDLQDQLLALQGGLQKTIVFITHDSDEAFRLGQYIVILRDGRIEQAGTPEEIRNAPANEYVRRFVQRRH